jgi:hypothetical protein
MKCLFVGDVSPTAANAHLFAAVHVGALGEAEPFEKFAHYLDCEAHLDVWMELFKTHNHRNEL